MGELQQPLMWKEFLLSGTCLVDPEMTGDEGNIRELLADERRKCLELQDEMQSWKEQGK